MKQDPSYFDDKDPQLVYIAKRLRDAKRLEAILTAAGVNYGVEADRYRGGVLFQSERIGAFFYVLPEVVEIVRRLMLENGYHPHEP